MKIIEFEVDPYQGFVALAVAIKLKGYKLVKAERNGKVGKAYFRRIASAK